MKRIVIKIGSSSLIKNGKLDNKRLLDLIREISILHDSGVKAVIVTSGAIACGAYKLGVKPKDIKMKQACAAVGQAILMNGYERICDLYDLRCAQILVSHEDFEKRNRMLHLENTLNTLIDNDVIPIINENDALAVDEIVVGDNDTMSALIAPMANADRVVLLTDIDGLYTDNPRVNKDAKFIRIIPEITEEIISYGHGSGSEVGTGGMSTKLKAAKIATSAGIDMVIMNASKLDRLHDVYSPNFEGSLFIGNKDKLNIREHWILYKTRPQSSIVVDDGCALALKKRKSLLAKGIISVLGAFNEGDVVNVISGDDIVAKGIVNYDSNDVIKIKGVNSKDINTILGHKGKSVVIHANNMVLTEDNDYE